MSRIGKIPLPLPKDVKVQINPTVVNLEGPKGKLALPLPVGIKVEQNDKGLCILRVNDAKQNRANHGTVRALLKNMIHGVTKGHTRDLEIQGLGFRAQASGQKQRSMVQKSCGSRLAFTSSGMMWSKSSRPRPKGGCALVSSFPCASLWQELSESMTWILSIGQPSAAARSRRAYCRFVLSVFSITWRSDDWRT